MRLAKWILPAIFGVIIPLLLQPMIPNRPDILWPLIGFSVLVAIGITVWELPRRATTSRRTPLLAISLMVIGFLIYGAGGLLFYFTNRPKAQSTLTQSVHTPSVKPASVSEYLPKPLTLKNLFDTDFHEFKYGWLAGSYPATSKSTGETRIIPWNVFWDFRAKSMFLMFFIKSSPADLQRTISECIFIADNYHDVINEAQRLGFPTIPPGDTSATDIKDLVFSGRIYLYVEDNLSLQQLAAIEARYIDRKLSVQIRGEYYRLSHSQEDRLAFLSME